jgi:hypothetical protein
LIRARRSEPAEHEGSSRRSRLSDINEVSTMKSLLLSLERQTGRVVPIALLGVTLASASACSDAARTPTAPRDTPAASKALIGGGDFPQIAAFATVRIVDIHGHPLHEPATVTFTSYPSKDSVVVTDNGAGDYDSNLSFMKVALKPGQTYEACFRKSYYYLNDNANPLYPACSTVTTSSLTVDLGQVYGRRTPRFMFYSQDIYGNLVPGATLQISQFGWTGIIKDADLNFGGSLDGIIKFETRNPPTATTWCEYSPPYKYQLLTPKCGSIMTEWDKGYTVTWVHQKLLY